MLIAKDFQYALRLLLKTPGFTALTIFVMTTGIGLSVYLFSFMNVMIFKDLPFEDGDEIVALNRSVSGSRTIEMMNLHDFEEIRQNSKDLHEFNAYREISANIASRDGARRYTAIEAEPNIFAFTRVQPLLGRGFSTEENRLGADRVAVIGYAMWQNLFAGATTALDATLRINGELHRIIGVMPEGYLFPTRADLWLPLRENVAQVARADSGSVFGLARIKNKASLPEVNRQIDLIMQRIAERYPHTNTSISAYASPLPLQAVGEGMAVVYSLQVVAILILILASVNVGNLLLSRGIERGKETAIRSALGAPRWRLVSQMLWESIIICSCGGLLGLLFLGWGLEVTEKIVATFFPDGANFWMVFGFDRYTLTLFFSVVLITIIATGLLPALKNTTADINTVLRDGTRNAMGRTSGRLNRVLVIGEIFISITILIAASVTVISAYRVTHTHYAATEGVLTARIALPRNAYADENDRIIFTDRLITRLQSDPAINSVALANALPAMYTWRPPIVIEGRDYSSHGSEGYPRVNHVTVSSNALADLGVRLKEGRYFTTSDSAPDAASIIVTESFARQHFASGTAIGQRLRLVAGNNDADGENAKWATIVGVVEHTYHGPANELPGKSATIYQPFAQAPGFDFSLALKINRSEKEAISALRAAVKAIDSDLPVFRVIPYQEVVAQLTGPMQFISQVFLLFGIAALVLAISGIYGVMANTVLQRTQEIGVKRALGAQDSRITGEYLKRGFAQYLWGAIPGITLGSLMGFGMLTVMLASEGQLLTVSIIIALLIAIVVLAASYIPTRKVLKIPPNVALRYE